MHVHMRDAHAFKNMASDSLSVITAVRKLVTINDYISVLAHY